MKNTLKRILLLLPVISVLLVALAVPAFADYSPETGWDAPVGTFEPFEADVNVEGSDLTIPIGLPFEIAAGEVNFAYKMVFTGWPRNANQDAIIIDGMPFILHLSVPGKDAYFLCSYLRLTSSIDTSGNGMGHILYFKREGFDFEIQVNLADESPAFYLLEYPFGDAAVGEALEGYSFEVYEAGSPPAVEPVTSVFTDIMTWITSAMTSVMGAFYVDGSLTLLGTLAVIGVSVGIGFLLIGLIQRFLHLRG